MRPVLAIDPGPEESAWCFFDGQTIVAKKESNDWLLSSIRRGQWDTEYLTLAVEMVASYGMPVGAEVFETCVWIGRFIEAWGAPARRVFRLRVKMHLCHDSRAKDANIRQALIDRFGAPGTKKAPGRTYGLSGDCWSALAVAVTALETDE